MELKSDIKNISIQISDDGPGFPEDIINILGEPYIKSKKINYKSGLGLGTFLGKTLLERQGAKLSFFNQQAEGGAFVKIDWTIKSLISVS